ncbi:GerAB/ArcD/ProY family transporter [Paenibacillus bouchesdurhonensis]|uniref:GerAB/ArcD/ProY family transporter n=1 Tax=Paenibacillus bouchesdurhonensis TaxID=1870990 RepID=UPI000DA63C64|nr:endospore germination permease [Paenibacillus bouchesdurhonensis]
MNPPKPTALQAIMTIMLTVGITNHVFIIPALLQTAKRDAWFSVILSVVPFVFITLLIAYISSRTNGKPLPVWLENQYGKVISIPFKIITSVYFLGTAWFALFDTIMWTKVTFLPYTPMIVTAAGLVLVCLIAARLGVNSMAYASGILLPLVVLLGFYVAIVNVQFKDYHQLFPLLENGWGPPIKGVMYACTGLFEIFFILFLQPYLKAPLTKRHFLVLGFILIGLTLGPLTGSIAEFNPHEASLQRYPAYEQWRIAGFGKYVSQTDFFSIYQWLAGVIMRIAVALFIATDIWNISNKQQRNTLLLLYSVALTLLCLTTFTDIQFQNLLIRFVFPFNTFLILIVTLLLTLAVFIRSLKKGEPIHDK